MKLKQANLTAMVLALTGVMVFGAPAQACGWNSGCGQRTTERILNEYGPRVPDSIRRGADAVRRGAERYADEFEHSYGRPSIRGGRVTVPNPWTGLVRPRCAGENC